MSRMGGRIGGELAAGEDRPLLERALVEAPDLVLSGRARILLHADHATGAAVRERDASATKRMQLLRQGRLKRYVFRLRTSAGDRIVKIAEVNTLGKALIGVAGSSNARREHDYHLRAERLGVAATRTKGYLEWRRGPRLLRNCQIQTVLSEDRVTLDSLFAQELAAHGDAAVDGLAAAIADMHRLRFFHADLKGFHAFPCGLERTDGGAARYRLEWLDLGRVSFWLSRRKRIINLYQVMRFILPADERLHALFVHAYCRHSGWHASAPERAYGTARRFLLYKLRTHPEPFG